MQRVASIIKRLWASELVRTATAAPPRYGQLSRSHDPPDSCSTYTAEHTPRLSRRSSLALMPAAGIAMDRWTESAARLALRLR